MNLEQDMFKGKNSPLSDSSTDQILIEQWEKMGKGNKLRSLMKELEKLSFYQTTKDIQNPENDNIAEL